MRNHLIKKYIIGYNGKNSFLANSFIKTYKKNFIFKCYSGDINNYSKFSNWIKKNQKLNFFINFAAITEPKKCNNNKRKALKTNFISLIKNIQIINNSKLHNFQYFLFVSSSHVFKNSVKKLNENSKKKPSNYYGKTKLLSEMYILKNKNKFTFKLGIARIFNYYNKNSRKSFFINDIRKKLKNKNKFIKYSNINTYRDFISIKNINTALFHMIHKKLSGDFNICSGEKIYLPDIVKFLNYKSKKIIFDSKKIPGLVGSNSKLKKSGWVMKNNNLFNELLK